MFVRRILLGFGFLALATASACGESVSYGTNDPDASIPAESTCATDADCSGDTPKCTQSGKCVWSGACDVDADCRDANNAFCHPYMWNCAQCRDDTDCPSDEPVCARGWEYGVYCAECRYGDSTTCPAETWCTPHFPVNGGGGLCKAPDCASDPSGQACLACQNENYAGCDGDDAECAQVLEALRACNLAADPTWDERNCSILVVPSLRPCSPQVCTDEAAAVDACLTDCEYVRERCET